MIGVYTAAVGAFLAAIALPLLNGFSVAAVIYLHTVRYVPFM